MALQPQERRQLRVLLLKALDGALDSVQQDQLECLLSREAEARRYYLDLLDMAKALHDSTGLVETGEADRVLAVDEQMLRALAELERTSPSVPQESPVMPAATSAVFRECTARRSPAPSAPSRFWLRVVKLAVAACVGLLVFAWLNPGPAEPVCLVAATHNAQWDAGSDPVTQGDLLYSQDPVRVLRAGIVKLVFDRRTEALIEGPATFACQGSNLLYLQNGKVCAYVPQAETGFTVRTPESQVLDLGTEFGVEVYPSGSRVQVFQGKVQLGTLRESQTLRAGLAGSVHRRAQQIAPSTFEAESFVRYMDGKGTFIWRGQALELCDAVADGNGFGGGVQGMGISVLSGSRGVFRGPGLLQRAVPGYRALGTGDLVDGVFAVTGSSPVISSTGLEFVDCPRTSGMLSVGIIGPAGLQSGVVTAMISSNAYRLSGVTSGGDQADILSVPANCGITFDLEAMRQEVRGVVLDRFVTECGVSETFFDYRGLIESETGWRQEPCADFFVLVDGRVAFERRDVRPSDGAVAVDLSLEATDRFLTLVVTEGKDEQVLYDWTMFVRPRIELQRK